MSRPRIPTDNASCERFIGTLKRGEIYLKDYDDFDDAEASIGRFIGVVYNRKRLHSALGYVPPAEFEVSPQGRSLMPTRSLASCCRKRTTSR